MDVYSSSCHLFYFSGVSAHEVPSACLSPLHFVIDKSICQHGLDDYKCYTVPNHSSDSLAVRDLLVHSGGIHNHLMFSPDLVALSFMAVVLV